MITPGRVLVTRLLPRSALRPGDLGRLHARLAGGAEGLEPLGRHPNGTEHVSRGIVGRELGQDRLGLRANGDDPFLSMMGGLVPGRPEKPYRARYVDLAPSQVAHVLWTASGQALEANHARDMTIEERQHSLDVRVGDRLHGRSLCGRRPPRRQPGTACSAGTRRPEPAADTAHLKARRSSRCGNDFRRARRRSLPGTRPSAIAGRTAGQGCDLKTLQWPKRKSVALHLRRRCAVRVAVVLLNEPPRTEEYFVHAQIRRYRAAVRKVPPSGRPLRNQAGVLGSGPRGPVRSEVKVLALAGSIGQGDHGLAGRPMPSVRGIALRSDTAGNSVLR